MSVESVQYAAVVHVHWAAARAPIYCYQESGLVYNVYTTASFDIYYYYYMYTYDMYRHERSL